MVLLLLATPHFLHTRLPLLVQLFLDHLLLNDVLLEDQLCLTTRVEGD